MQYPLVVIGAGAAGLAAAVFAAQAAKQGKGQSSQILLLDGAKKPGAKILVSGGGRCNVTNACVTPEDYWGGSRNVIRNVLRRFSAEDTVAWMDSLGVKLKEEEPWGKLFPVTDSARTVLDALLGRVKDLGVHTRFGFRVKNLTPAEDSAWNIVAEDGQVIQAARVIIATGGKALPKSGSDGAGYEWLRRLGHTIIPPVPALAPLVLDEGGVEGSPFSRRFGELSGVSIEARLSESSGKYDRANHANPILFTHFGLSGPLAMDLSRHLARDRQQNPHAKQWVSLKFDLPEKARGNVPLKAAEAWLLDAIERWPRATVANVLIRIMPDRMAQMLAETVNNKRLCDLTRDERRGLAELLIDSRLAVKGDRGFSFAEATAGGVALDEVNWRTMESRKAPGLYLCGEVLDVDGRIGGFNFQWAWSSGHIAGSAAGAK